MFKKIFPMSLMFLSCTSATSVASTCTEQCGVVIFKNKTLNTINGVSVNNAEKEKAIAGTANLPPGAMVRVYFNDKTKDPIKFVACNNFQSLPVGCAMDFTEPTNSCSYPKHIVGVIIKDQYGNYRLICK